MIIRRIRDSGDGFIVRSELFVEPGFELCETTR
jgi:hypothetical protein